MGMHQRFEGDVGRRLRLEALATQKLVGGNRELAEALTDRLPLRQLGAGDRLIEQGDSDNTVYLILAGAFDVVVNGRVVGRRQANDHVGEMAAVEPSQRRAASIIAVEDSVVAVLAESDLAEFGARYPEIYRCIARELARRLLQRNAFVNATHERIRVFIISSVEVLPVARAIQNAFEHDPFLTTVWTDGCSESRTTRFNRWKTKSTRQTLRLPLLTRDDMTHSRGKDWPSPRDNVIFELGLFMGRLGRARAILMEPREQGVKLPSDLAGITTISYRFQPGINMAAILAPACNALREYILRLGPNN